MRDLTRGPIREHLIAMSIPMAIGMAVQMLYYMVDLYFVGKLGSAALAGVSAAGNTTLITLGLTQVISVSSVALISQAVGRDDKDQVNNTLNQSILIAAIGSFLTLILGYLFAEAFMEKISATTEIAALGTSYLYWFLPGLAMQFILAALGSALRGMGVTQPTMVIQLLTVALNIILSPILITGAGIIEPQGVAGAALATSISVGIGVLLMFRYFIKNEVSTYFRVSLLRPCFKTWKKIFKIGLPAGGEYIVMFLFTVIVYYAIKDFGAVAQAGFGIGARIMQVVFLPAVAIGFAVPAVAGQNYGAKLGNRVRDTLKTALGIELFLMVILTAIYQYNPSFMLGILTSDQEVIASAAEMLKISSWNFIASGMLFACSGIFQALGNTIPSFICILLRLIVFVIALNYLMMQQSFELTQVWYLSVVTVAIQSVVCFYLVYREMNLKLISEAGSEEELVNA